MKNAGPQGSLHPTTRSLYIHGGAATGAGPVCAERITVRGKFLFEGERKFWVRGVTYGTFRPGEADAPFPAREVVKQDFAMMTRTGINSVRTYVPPPIWLLDLAQQAGLRVMVGLAWEQHVTFLDDPKLPGTIEARVRDGVNSCSGHPAVLCFSIGNEIPPSIVRWHGRRRIERFLHRLYVIGCTVHLCELPIH